MLTAKQKELYIKTAHRSHKAAREESFKLVWLKVLVWVAKDMWKENLAGIVGQ